MTHKVDSRPLNGRHKTPHKPITRSENMARIRNKDTKPEMLVRSALWEAGLRY